MRLPSAAFGRFVVLVALSAVAAAANQASCTFTTFSAPAGYDLSQVNDVTDDGTVVRQLEGVEPQSAGTSRKLAASASPARLLRVKLSAGAVAGLLI